MATHDEPFTTHNLDDQLKLSDQQVDEQSMTPNEQAVSHLRDLYSVQAQVEQQRTQRVYARLQAATVEDTFLRQEEQAHLFLLPQQEASQVPHESEPPKRRRRPVAMWLQTVAALLVAALLVGGFLATLSLVRHSKSGTTASPGWQRMNSANKGTNFQALTKVAVISKQDVWAIGESGTVMTANVPIHTDIHITALIEHWNGQQWSVIPAAQLKASIVLRDITAVSSRDVWAVGGVGNVAKKQTMFSTLIEHWDGRQWSIVASPSPGKAANALIAVKALSANNIWAVGYSIDDASTGIAHTLVEHWNGQQWSVVASPDDGSYRELEGISIVDANNIWSVGSAQGPGTSTATLIEHWNGQRWSIVDSPGPGTATNDLSAVIAISSTDIWATGEFFNDSNHTKTLIEHWNGQQWSVVASPATRSSFNYLLIQTTTNEKTMMLSTHISP